MRYTGFLFIALLIILAGCVTQSPAGSNPAGTPPLPTGQVQQNSSSQVSPSNQPSNTGQVSQVSIVQGPTFECNLFENPPKTLGIAGADLGVPVVEGSSQWLIFGDTMSKSSTSMAGPGGAAGGSSVIESSIPFNCSHFSWVTPGASYFQPLTSKRIAGVDESTVPAGALTLDGTIYLYAMRVTHWGTATDPSVSGYGVLFRQDPDGSFTQTANWGVDQVHVNTAPVLGALSDRTPAVFMAMSGKYRNSPVYLAYVLPSGIGDPAHYHYLTGYGPDGSPHWTSDISQAEPIPGLEDLMVGELSLIYDAPLSKYLLFFKDYKQNLFLLYSADAPYGPYTKVAGFDPCETPTGRPSWMQSGWEACYGGYLIPGDFGLDGHELHFTLSVWVPYTTTIMKMEMNTASGAPG
jgi:Domain of unknown function (DUF4185)